MATQKILYIDYHNIYQQLTTDSDEVREEFIAFLERLIEKGFKIIASTEYGNKTQKIQLSIDDSRQIKEAKIE